MSNCIELSGKTTKIFSDRDFDIVALKELIDAVRDLPEAPKGVDGYIAWWFLTQSEFRASLAFVTIAFGEGRSTHTFRDFRATLMLLARFSKRPVKIRFMARDTDWDNNSKPSACYITLLPGGNVLGL